MIRMCLVPVFILKTYDQTNNKSLPKSVQPGNAFSSIKTAIVTTITTDMIIIIILQSLSFQRLPIQLKRIVPKLQITSYWMTQRFPSPLPTGEACISATKDVSTFCSYSQPSVSVSIAAGTHMGPSLAQPR